VIRLLRCVRVRENEVELEMGRRYKEFHRYMRLLYDTRGEGTRNAVQNLENVGLAPPSFEVKADRRNTIVGE
jgi:hypothetical protein